MKNKKNITYLREIEIKYKPIRANGDFSNTRITGPEVVAHLFRDLENETKEKFIVISLDGANKIMCFEVVAIGSANTVGLKPFQVFRTSIVVNSVSQIVVHNHPSGEIDPSNEDKKFTEKLLYFSKEAGLHLLDHIIIGYNKHFSFAAEGLLLSTFSLPPKFLKRKAKKSLPKKEIEAKRSPNKRQ
jgi:DNA repair protein RadC